MNSWANAVAQRLNVVLEVVRFAADLSMALKIADAHTARERRRVVSIRGLEDLTEFTPDDLKLLFDYIGSPGCHVEVTANIAKQTIQFLKETN